MRYAQQLVALAVVVAAVLPARPAMADTVVPDDQIVQGSACAGPACADGESFGFDTLRLKGPTLRLGFLDTSAGAFPTNDWALTANDADGAGSENFFAFTDVTAGTSPLRILAGAPTDSVRVNADGNVVLGHGTLVQRLDDIESAVPADRPALVTALASLPISTYEIAGDPADRKHIGPTALDFTTAFGLGDGQSLAPADTAGVALAVAQELTSRVDQLRGPAGPQGATGPAGPAGGAGAPGPAGPAGLSADQAPAFRAASAQLARLEKAQAALVKRNAALTKRVKQLEARLRRRSAR